jgi:hypothetical protein
MLNREKWERIRSLRIWIEDNGHYVGGRDGTNKRGCNQLAIMDAGGPDLDHTGLMLEKSMRSTLWNVRPQRETKRLRSFSRMAEASLGSI